MTSLDFLETDQGVPVRLLDIARQCDAGCGLWPTMALRLANDTHGWYCATHGRDAWAAYQTAHAVPEKRAL
jgi:hypothetical protein